MNILAISNLYNTNLIKPKETNQNANYTTLTMAKPLTQDTVSFGAGNKMAQWVGHNAEKELPRLERLATTYLDVLESVANKLKDFGVTFNREYCEQHPVKSVAAQLSKITRSKSLQLPDKVRATLYVQNPYDLSVLNDHILPELQKRGFIINKIPGNIDDLIRKGYIPDIKEVSGKDVMVPDLDIRLANIADQINKLSPEYRFCIGKPQKSGYEDIQMRLIRDYDPKSNPVQHELLILMGENYAYAKHLESKYVYNALRTFDELGIVKKGNEKNENYQAVQRCINLIKRLMNAEISHKLFDNAKKLDLTKETDYKLIKIAPETVEILELYFNQLIKNLNAYNRDINASKRIQDGTKKKISAELKQDKATIEEIHNKLKDTIKFFNEKNYLKRKHTFD